MSKQAFEKIKSGLDEAIIIAPYVAEIERLRAENEKLRAETLEAAANVADTKARTVGNGRDEYSLACRHIAQELRAAAAALKGNS